MEILELFNEKADEFLGSRFFREARGGGAIVEFRRDAGWDSLFVGPEDESVKALVLTLRLFMQNNDRLSLHNMAKLYDSLPLSADVVGDFARCRSELNAFLDSDSRLAIEEDRQLTYRDILEIFVYGTYAHVNAQHRGTFEAIRTTPFFPLFQASLVRDVDAFGRCVGDLRRLNEQALRQLAPDHEAL